MRASRYLVRFGVLGAMMTAMVALSAAVATAEELPDASCQATSDSSLPVGRTPDDGPGGPNRWFYGQVGQTFTALNSGRLTSASVMLLAQDPREPLEVEIRPADGASGAPGTSVLARALVNNVPVGPNYTLVNVRFDPGAEVVAGQRYALVLSASRSVGSYEVAVNTSNPCPDGGAFFTRTKNLFEGGVLDSTDVIFSTFVTPPPVATNDSYSTAQDRRLRVAAPGLLSNDSASSGDALTAAKITDPSHGEVVVNADGSFAYLPEEGYLGTDSFSYRAIDSIGKSNAAKVRIQVKDTTKPTISPISPKPTLTIRNTRPTIKATVKDNTTLRKTNIKLYVAGELIGARKYTYDTTTGALVYNSPKLSTGKKAVKIVATDAARNVRREYWHFTIKRTVKIVSTDSAVATNSARNVGREF